MRKPTLNLPTFIEKAERSVYWLVALALMAGSFVYLLFVIYEAGKGYLSGEFTLTTLHLLNGTLLALMLAQLVFTTVNFLHTGILKIEPVLIVGIIAAVRRMLLISATFGIQVEPLAPIEFRQVMIELSLLILTTLALSISTHLLRIHSRKEDILLQGVRNAKNEAG